MKRKLNKYIYESFTSNDSILTHILLNNVWNQKTLPSIKLKNQSIDKKYLFVSFFDQK
jgi:hypothetical protein